MTDDSRLAWGDGMIEFEEDTPPVDKAKTGDDNFDESEHPRDDEGKFKKKDSPEKQMSIWAKKNPGLFGAGKGSGDKPKKKWFQADDEPDQPSLFSLEEEAYLSGTPLPLVEGQPKKPAPPPKPKKLPDIGVTFLGIKGDPPAGSINGIPFSKPPDEFWKTKMYDPFPGEPPMPVVTYEYTYEVKNKETGQKEERIGYKTLRQSSGAILLEPDGRLWIVEPDNHFGGYDTTFPKGGVEKDLTPQQNALKEIFEETGLQAELTGYLADMEGDTSITRYYLGRRVGGNPHKAHWETYSVRLVTLDEAEKLLNRTRDQDVLKKLRARLQTKSAANAYVVSAPSAAASTYLSSNLNVPEPDGHTYHNTDVSGQPTLIVEIVPLGLNRGQIVRFQRLSAKVVGNVDPNIAAMQLVRELYGTGYLEMLTWRPADGDLDTLTYGLLLDVPAENVPQQNFPVVQISAITVTELDENSLAVDCVERIAKKALIDNAYAARLPNAWLDALRSFLPAAGRELW